MSNPIVRSDDDGLFVRTNGQIYRPGAVGFNSIRLRMDAGDAAPGEPLRARPVDGTELLKVKLRDGTTTYWHVDGPTRIRGMREAPKDAVWKADGTRDMRNVMIG